MISKHLKCVEYQRQQESEEKWKWSASDWRREYDGIVQMYTRMELLILNARVKSAYTEDECVKKIEDAWLKFTRNFHLLLKSNVCLLCRNSTIWCLCRSHVVRLLNKLHCCNSNSNKNNTGKQTATNQCMFFVDSINNWKKKSENKWIIIYWKSNRFFTEWRHLVYNRTVLITIPLVKW